MPALWELRKYGYLVTLWQKRGKLQGKWEFGEACLVWSKGENKMSMLECRLSEQAYKKKSMQALRAGGSGFWADSQQMLAILEKYRLFGEGELGTRCVPQTPPAHGHPGKHSVTSYAFPIMLPNPQELEELDSWDKHCHYHWLTHLLWVWHTSSQKTL